MSGRKDYTLIVQGDRVAVCEAVYRAYYQQREHEKYLEKKSKEHEYSYESMQTQGISFEFHSGIAAPSPEDEFLKKQSLCCIRKAIEELGQEDRYLISAVFGAELSQKEIAEKLGITQPAVAARKKQILKKLKMLLDEQAL